MSEFIVIQKSVGAKGINLAPDVLKIGAALTLLGPMPGPDRGGVFAPPLSTDGLVQAIRRFQTFQNLRIADGRIDPGGSTLKRINALLNPGAQPSPSPEIGRTGKVRYVGVAPSGMPGIVNKGVWSPIEQSLTSELIFKWGGVLGGGTIYYFELDEDVVPNWFGVLVPAGLTNFEHVHIFFHPTPAQAGYIDGNYKSKTGWGKLFHYLSDDMAAQFCAANSGQVLVMPLFTQGAANSCGVFPQRWESVIGQMLGQIASGNMSQSAPPRAISSVVVSSFSSGITYSAMFRSKANLGGKLRGVIDFDGIISSYKQHSQALAPSAVRMWQIDAASQTLRQQAAQNMFPLRLPRWVNGPFKFTGNTTLQVHGAIPQTKMFVAARRTAVI